MAVSFNRNFLLLWQGQLVSQLGSQAFLIATAYYTLEATGTATLVAAVMMAMTVPVVILGPVAGTLADRHSRRAILIATDLLRALAVGGLGLFVLWRPDAMSHHILLIIATAAFGGVMAALFAPAVQALIPDLVPDEDLAAANSIIQASRQTSTLIGQALGGVLYVACGPAAMLLFDALSFLYAGTATSFLPPDRKLPRRRGVDMRLAVERCAADTRAGMAYVWRRTGMTAVLVAFACVNFLFMPVFVLLPLYTREVLAAGAEWYGFLLSGSGAGALAGSIAAGAVLARVPASALVRGAIGGVAACVLLLALTRSSWLALAAFAAIGALSSVINVTVTTAFQSSVPSDIRGRVMALVIAVSTAVVPFGMALGGVLGDLWRESLSLVFAGCGIVLVVLAGASCSVRAFATLLDGSNLKPTIPGMGSTPA